MSVSRRRRRPDPAAPAAPAPEEHDEDTAWLQAIRGAPAAAPSQERTEDTSWFQPVRDTPAATPSPRPAPEPPAERTGEQPAVESTAPATRRRRRRRAMRTGRRVALQLLAALILTGALVGLRGYDALDRYETREPPPVVLTVPLGQGADFQYARWRLVSIGPMPSPPENNRPERMWLELKLEVTPLEKAGTDYAAFLERGPFALVLEDGDGRTWRVEVLRAPKELRVGEPGEFTLVAVAPTALSERVRLVLWPEGKPGSGKALRFER
jgi:hypothetical protein